MKASLPNDPRRIKLEVKKEGDKYFEERFTEIDTMILWILHIKFGFGKVRLRRYFDTYLHEAIEMQGRYGDSYVYKMQSELKKIGVDVVEWEKEIK